MPLGRAPVPVIEPDFAAKMHHQRFEPRRRIELKAHCVQLVFARHQVGPEAAQVFHQNQRVLLLLEKPH